MSMIKGWEKMPFGEIASLVKGISYASEDYCGPGQGTIFLTIKCVSKAGGFKPEGIKYFKGKIVDSQELHVGDLLIANTDLTRAGDIVGAPIVVPSFNGETITMSMDLSKVVEDDRKIDRRFLYFMLMTDSVRRFMKDHASGSTVLHLQTRAVPKLEIVIPSKKSEQHKIAEVLSTVDQAIEQTEALIAKQQRIKTGLMQDLLTRGIDENGNLRSEETHEFKDSPLGRIPVGWEVKTIGNLAAQVTKGESPTWQGFKYHEEGILFITSENVRAGFLDITKSEKFVSDTFHKKLKRSALRYGDILVNLVGASIARSAVYDLDRDANINQAVCSVRLSNEVKPLWLCEYLQLSKNIERLLGEQVETARANLSLGDIRSYLVPYPPPAEQSRVIMQINLLRNEYEYQVGSLTKLRSLKTGLMQDLLTGKVSVTPLLTEEERNA